MTGLEAVSASLLVAPAQSAAPATQQLDAADFINVTDPGPAALGQLLTGPATATARTAVVVSAVASVAASVGTSVATSTAASGAAGAAGSSASGPGLAAAVPALMGAQRFAMYGRMGGAPSGEDADAADPTGWMSGSFGFVSAASFAATGTSDTELGAMEPDAQPSSRGAARRLQSKGGGGGGGGGGVVVRRGGGEDNADRASRLVASLQVIDRLLCAVVTMSVCFSVQYALLTWWATRANRKYYAAVRARKSRQQSVGNAPARVAPFFVNSPPSSPPRLGGQFGLRRSPPPPPKHAFSSSSPPPPMISLAPASTVSMQSMIRLNNVKRCAKQMPKFRSVPRALLWPNPQVAAMLVFSGGIIEAATAILGASAAGYPMPTWSVATAYAAILAIFLFVASQVRAIYRFYLSYREECWSKSDAPDHRSEMDDPLLALLCRLRLIRPRSREQGGWILPDEEAVEPQRTELRLARAFDCPGSRRQQQSGGGGGSLERLQLWTRDGSASPTGAAFGVVIITVQFMLSLNTGFLFVHPWARTSSGQKARLSTNAVLQVCCALYTAGPAANDVLHGFGIAVVFLFEAAATLCLLASAVVMDGGSADAANNAPPAMGNASLLVSNASDVAGNASLASSNASDLSAAAANASALASASDEEQLSRVAQALQFATVSASLLSFSIYVPLLLTVYDGIFVPFAKHVSSHEGSISELACALLVSMVVLPIQVAKFFLGINAEVADIASEYTDTSKEVTFTQTESYTDEVREVSLQRRGGHAAPWTLGSSIAWSAEGSRSRTEAAHAEGNAIATEVVPIQRPPQYAHAHDPEGMSEAQEQEWRLAAWIRASQRELELKQIRIVNF